ncbi:MAG: radical SAM protein, partial [Armatimonadota bacterium]|nr:radical SAM protein [Armatimonadota bacterium]
MRDNYLLFRFVPTMRCNYRCAYCFLPGSEKSTNLTMFDEHTPDEWVRAMANFSDYDVEFYAWGGEPFLLDGTYKVVKGWCEHKHVISGNRIDTNMAFAEKIARKCPTEKLKLNCSWHTQYNSLDHIYSKITSLNNLDMVAMLNFVASEQNIHVLKDDYCMTIDDLIAKFADAGIFVNIAADFGIVNGKDASLYSAYKDMILNYLNPEDWRQLRCEKQPSHCEANHHFFTVHPNGDITPCLSGKVCGNFFDGTLEFPECQICAESCPSLVSYPFRTDNEFPYKRHIVEYVNRNKEHRERVLSSGLFVPYDVGTVLSPS